MSLKCGIVGLPNVGKSTLFNALTKTAAAEAANYPFCTIEPNIGNVGVPDERMPKLAKIADSQEIIATQIEFVDIAGLVKGASKGEGLGNQFLSHIREVDAIVNVVRCFEDGDITHVEGNVDPIRDIELIQLELILADLESTQKRVQSLQKKARSNDKESQKLIEVAKKAEEILGQNKPAILTELKDDEERKLFKNLQLITAKPQILVCNVAEDEVTTGNEFTKRVADFGQENNFITLIISAKIEAEIAALPSEEEKQEFLEAIGLSQTGLAQIIRAGYGVLDLITFFTVGQKECRSWQIKNGCNAPKAAGEIHTDFEKGFIKAEVISYDDYIEFNGEDGCKAAGKLRLEGKDYIVKDGDVVHFRFNV